MPSISSVTAISSSCASAGCAHQGQVPFLDVPPVLAQVQVMLSAPDCSASSAASTGRDRPRGAPGAASQRDRCSPQGPVRRGTAGHRSYALPPAHTRSRRLIPRSRRRSATMTSRDFNGRPSRQESMPRAAPASHHAASVRCRTPPPRDPPGLAYTAPGASPRTDGDHSPT